MKAITIKQPFAYLVCAGIKDVENRTWKTNFRGRVLVHAGPVHLEYFNDMFSEKQMKFLKEKELIEHIKTVDLSAIIGAVTIVDCVRNHSSIWAEEEPYKWVLEDAVLFKNPVKDVKGKLSFWKSGYDEIICPECLEQQLHSNKLIFPVAGYSDPVHRCERCGYIMLESEF